MKKILVILLLISLIFAFSLNLVSADDTKNTSRAYELAVDFTTKHPYRKTASEEGVKASEYIREFFENLGIENEVQKFTYNAVVSDNYYYNTVVEKRDDQNVVGKIKTNKDTADTVVIGAHYDNTFESGTGTGFYDNGSGVGIMLALAEQFKKEHDEGKILPFNLTFVAFGAGEYALRGSEHFISKLKGEEINSILLYVNLDTIAGGENLYVYSDEVKTMQEDYFLNIARKSGVKLNPPPANKGTFYASISKLGYAHAGLSSDNVSFMNRDILSVSFSSFNWTAFVSDVMDESAVHENVLGTANDSAKSIDEIYGDSAKEKVDGAYTLVYNGLREGGFADYMRRAKRENTDYSLLTSRYFVPAIGAGFLIIVIAVILSLSKNYAKKHPPKKEDSGFSGEERPHVFEEFD